MAISRPSQLNAHFSDVLEVSSILCIHRTMVPVVAVTERVSFTYTRLLSSRTTRMARIYNKSPTITYARRSMSQLFKL
jgi:hypothetical protein